MEIYGNTGKHTWEHMGIHGNIWEHMEIYGNIHGNTPMETHGTTWKHMGLHGNTPHASQTLRRPLSHRISSPLNSQPRQSCQAQSVQCHHPPLHSHHGLLPCPAHELGFWETQQQWGQLTTPASSFSLGRAEHSQLGPQELFACWEAKTSHFQSASSCQGRAAAPEKGLAELARKAAPCPPQTHPAAPKPPPAPRGGAPC